MRQDQFEKLQALSEKLTDVGLDELDPDKWPGATTPIDQHDKTIRGDRYWAKKNGIATIGLVVRITHLIGVVRNNTNKGETTPAAVSDTADELEMEIQSTEREATALIARITSPKAKEEFTKKLNGKT